MGKVFDLDDAFMPGTSNAERLVACLFAMCIRDGASHLFLEPSHEEGVIGTIVQYRVSTNQYEIMPTPFKMLSSVRLFLRRQAGDCTLDEGRIAGWVSTRLRGHDFAVWMIMSVDGRDDRFAFHFPLRYDLLGKAGAFLRANSNGEGRMIEFLESEID